MRFPEPNIKPAILHAEQEVRLTALSYFSRSFSQDETVMPLVIRAVEKYGRENAFRILRSADDLVQTEATVAWVTNELRREMDLEDVTNDNYRLACALILCSTPPKSLSADMVDLPNFPEELKPAFLDRLKMADWDWDATWATFEELGKEILDLGEILMRHVRRAGRVIEALARHQDGADTILPLLHRRYRGKDRALMECLETSIIKVAGAMRLQKAIPILVERMYEDDFEVSDSCTIALGQIGGEEVVRALADGWQEGSGEYRRGAAEAISHIHSDLSVQKILEFLPTEKDPDTLEFLAGAALYQFETEAIEPVRQMVPGSWDDLTNDESDLRYHLVAAATVMEVTFPGYEEWYAHAQRERWGWPVREIDRIREHFCEDEEDNEGWEKDYDVGPHLAEDEEDVPLFRLDTFRHENQRIGRNDPCPCGSGKKYKKCCLNKDSSDLFQD